MNELPPVRLWADRASAMPYVAGGGENQIESLRTLLTDVLDRPDAGDVVAAVDRTRPTGVVERSGRSRWRVTEAGLLWLENREDVFLVGVLHASIKFVGELLYQVSLQTMAHSDLVEVARTEYDLIWTSPDQVRRRTTWLRCAGLLELRFDNYLEITEAGRGFLPRLALRPPNSELESTGSEVPAAEIIPPSGLIAQALGGLDDDALRGRRRLIGFLPAGKSVVPAIRSVVDAAQSGISREEWVQRFNRDFDLAATSALQALGSFRSIGLIEATGRDKYQSTALARAWLESDNSLDLVRIVHTRVRFMGELLAKLTLSESASLLTSEALNLQIPVGDLQRRLLLLLDANLIEESGVRRYRVTPIGAQFVHSLPLESSIASDESGGSSPEASASADGQTQEARKSSNHDLLAADLREAGRAASDHQRLERAVAAAFAFMGYSSEHLGGPGRTDVRAETTLSAGRRFVVIADAKASARGQVLPFDVVTLREHKEAHNADCVIAVGENFPDRRTVDRAHSEGVGLLTIARLVELMRLFSLGLIPVTNLNRLLSTPGLVTDEAIAGAVEERARLMRLARSVVACLAEEAAGDDEVTQGSLAPSGIYMLLRNETVSPGLREIEAILNFLCDPLVAAVERNGQNYSLTDHVAAVSMRLTSLGEFLGGASPSNNSAI